jgi:hypothetical protein
LSGGTPLALLDRLVPVEGSFWRTLPRLPKTALLFAAGSPAADADTLLALMRSIGPLPFAIAETAAAAREEVVRFPLAQPFPGRFNDGENGFGLWYAAFEPETALAEAAWHYRRRKVAAGIAPAEAAAEVRRLWLVPVAGELVADLTGARDRRLTADDYAFCRDIGRLAAEHLRGGLRYRSARAPAGRNLALMRERRVGEPRAEAEFSFVMEGGDAVSVTRLAGAAPIIFRFAPA